MSTLIVGGIELNGLSTQGLHVGGNGEAHMPINGEEPVVLANAIRGLEGTISGWVTEWSDAQDAMGYKFTTQDISIGPSASFTADVMDVGVAFEWAGSEMRYHLTFEVLGKR